MEILVDQASEQSWLGCTQRERESERAIWAALAQNLEWGVE